MRKNKFYIVFGVFIFALVIFTHNVKAQSIMDLRINEILVENDSNYEDDFGSRSSWIEIFNSANNYVNIGGCYLTNDIKNPKKYFIPKGDPITKIAPKSYLVFWADNLTTRGTLHLNFDLHETNFLALFSSDGRTLIDSFSYGPQTSDITYGRIENGGKQIGILSKTTPNSSNETIIKESSSEKFKKLDPWGIGMTVIAMTVVYLALILLYLTFKNLGKAYVRAENKKSEKENTKVENVKKDSLNENTASGEDYAAIAMAMYLYNNELHDQENTILTINKVSRNYSPWSSKIHGLRINPRR